MKMEFIEHAELVNYLRNYRSWTNPFDYDLVGMANLFGACLDNFRLRATEEELSYLSECLSDEQKHFLQVVAHCVKKVSEG